MRDLLNRLLDWFRRDALDRELADELKHHQQMLERDACARGVSVLDASYVARRQLGNLTGARELAREVWSIRWMDRLQQDIRYAIRGLRRSPGFTATVVVTLGLGIGANAAMFDVVDRLMFRPLAYVRDASHVHRLYWQWESAGVKRTATSSPYTRYLDMQRWTSSFSRFAAFYEADVLVGEGEQAREQRIAAVSASYFDFFSARPELGRFIGTDEDHTPRGADVAVLSYAFWKAEFGGRDVRGSVVQIGNVHATIVGVAPRNFSGVTDTRPPVVFVPITTFAASEPGADSQTYFTEYKWGWVNMLVQRKPGVSLERANADATQALRTSWQLARDDSPTTPTLEQGNPHAIVSGVRPFAGPNPSLESRTALWVSAVAAIVLIIACANTGNLLLARTLQRQRETAVRLALGVSRARLTAQSVIECMLLAMTGGGVALLIAQWGGAAIRGLLVSSTNSVSVIDDSRTIVVTLTLSIGVGLILGFLPSLFTRTRNLAGVLRAGARASVRDGATLRATLLVLQGALSMLLLVGAALFVKSLDRVQDAMGYDASRVLMVRRVVRGTMPGDSTMTAMRQQLMATAQAIPSVEAVAWRSSAPFISTSNTNIFVAGVDSTQRFGDFTYQATTSDYFRVMGTRIVRGRGLSEDDRAGTPWVTVVSESMAKVLWPGQEAIGKCIRLRADTAPCRTVVGIAQDMVQRDITGTRQYHYYMPIDQFTRTYGNGLLIKTRGDPALAMEGIRTALMSTLPSTSYVVVQPLREIVDNAQRAWRIGASMFAAFGVLALIVAAVGLYGVISYSVTQRMHELGVRAALGAQRHNILGLVVRRSVQLALAGVVLGAFGALVASRWIQPLLFRQSATDPAVFVSVGAIMLLVSLFASALPALRAANVDPNSALRSD